MTAHPVANLFPLMSDDEYQALKADIAQYGQRLPIETYQGQIIDGRNRERACRELRIVPNYHEWDGNESLVAFVVSLNLNRRHLTPSQKAAVAAGMLPMLEAEAKERQRAAGGDRKSNKAKRAAQEGESVGAKIPQPIPGREPKSTETAGKLMGVSGRYVAEAKKLARQAPELAAKVKAGELTLAQAKAEAGPKLFKATSRTAGPEASVRADGPIVSPDLRRRLALALASYLHRANWVPSRRLTSLCEVVIPGTIASRVYNHWRKNKHGPGSSDLFRRIEVGRNILITQTLQAWVKRGVAERHGERPGEYRLVRQLCLCADPYS
jgi:hypothetical protein